MHFALQISHWHSQGILRNLFSIWTPLSKMLASPALGFVLWGSAAS